MRIIQALPTISVGDAVSNDTRAIAKILAESGAETGIYAENLDPRLPRGCAEKINRLPRLSPEDILIYHASTGTRMNYDLPKYGGLPVMVYHNITPAVFFRGYSGWAEKLSRYGYQGICQLANQVVYCVADSEFNRQELIRMGFTCPVDVCPILIPFEDYDQAPDPQIMRQYQGDGWTNILFVGRIAPNKKQEDAIRAFHAYRRRYNPRSRLFLVGSGSGMELYEKRLKEYVKTLGEEENVIFSGHLKFSGILAYYHLADLFLCMSEHEGFCVPLVEAMYFDLPIVVYRSTAVPDTLGRGGLLLEEKDPELAAAAIHRILQDEDLRQNLREGQKEKLAEFSYEAVKARWMNCIEKMKAIGMGNDA